MDVCVCVIQMRIRDTYAITQVGMQLARVEINLDAFKLMFMIVHIKRSGFIMHIEYNIVYYWIGVSMRCMNMVGGECG